MDQLNGKDFMFACSDTFLRLQYEVCAQLWLRLGVRIECDARAVFPITVKLFWSSPLKLWITCGLQRFQKTKNENRRTSEDQNQHNQFNPSGSLQPRLTHHSPALAAVRSSVAGVPGEGEPGDFAPAPLALNSDLAQEAAAIDSVVVEEGLRAPATARAAPPPRGPVQPVKK